MQPVQNKWLPPGLPPIVQNGYPILSYVYMRLYEYLFVLMYIYFWYLTRSWRLIMPEELTLYLYIYINTSIIIVTGLVPLGHVTS